MRFLEYVEAREPDKKLIDTFGRYRVFVIDGEKVRNSSPAAEEFGGSGDHVWYPKVIPEDEIWIEDDVSEEERRVLIASELYFLRLVERGVPKKSAYDDMLAKQKDYRDSVRQAEGNPSGTDEKPDPAVYVKRYGHIRDGDIDVFLVDGEEVRNRYKTDFIEGGQPNTYAWVPNNEIWVELGPHTRDEAPYIILHEYVEMCLMRYHDLDYDHAHEIAAKVEFGEREKGGFSKEDALSLTKAKALDMTAKYAATQAGKKK